MVLVGGRIRNRATMASNELGVSVVVPVFNSGLLLPELVRRIEASVFADGRDGEILLVNDASRDGSWDEIRRLSGGRVNGLDLLRQYGQHGALIAGVAAAKFPVIVTLDDDLDQPPEAIPRLLEKLSEGFDLVFGVPRSGAGCGMRGVFSRAAHWVLSRSSQGKRPSPFRAFRAELKAAFPQCSPQFVTLDVLLHWSARRTASVAVDFGGSRLGRSRQSPRSLVDIFLNGVTGIGLWPLRLLGLAGVIAFLSGGAWFVFWISRWSAGAPVPSEAWWITAALVLFGLQAAGMGILGEFVGRSHLFQLRLPPPVIRRRTEEGA